MGQYYYVNTKTGLSRVYLVHSAQCSLLPPRDERLFLGTFYAPLDAIKQAKKYYAHAEGCKKCCPGHVKKRAAQPNPFTSAPLFSC